MEPNERDTLHVVIGCIAMIIYLIIMVELTR